MTADLPQEIINLRISKYDQYITFYNKNHYLEDRPVCIPKVYMNGFNYIDIPKHIQLIEKHEKFA